MKTFFMILRITTGFMLVGGLLILLAIIVMRSAAAFAKESVGAIGYVATLFTSGFTKGTAPRTSGWVASLPQAGLALLFIAMFVTLFLPGTKIFLHVVAAGTALAVVWYARMLLTQPTLEVFCLPILVFWIIYYAMSLSWYAHQPLPPGSGGVIISG
jgi:hypothetical protein